MTQSLSQTFASLADIANKADHIQRTMTTPKNGVRLSYDEARNLLKLAMQAVNQQSEYILERM